MKHSFKCFKLWGFVCKTMFKIILVCFTIKTKAGKWWSQGIRMNWSFGHCYSAYEYRRTDYRHSERCCLIPGKFTLTCENTKKPVGWYEGYVEIQGHKYCHDFMGYKAMRQITIAGIQEKS